MGKKKGGGKKDGPPQGQQQQQGQGQQQQGQQQQGQRGQQQPQPAHPQQPQQQPLVQHPQQQHQQQPLQQYTQQSQPQRGPGGNVQGEQFPGLGSDSGGRGRGGDRSGGRDGEHGGGRGRGGDRHGEHGGGRGGDRGGYRGGEHGGGRGRGGDRHGEHGGGHGGDHGGYRGGEHGGGRGRGGDQSFRGRGRGHHRDFALPSRQEEYPSPPASVYSDDGDRSRGRGRGRGDQRGGRSRGRGDGQERGPPHQEYSFPEPPPVSAPRQPAPAPAPVSVPAPAQASSQDLSSWSDNSSETSSGDLSSSLSMLSISSKGGGDGKAGGNGKGGAWPIPSRKKLMPDSKGMIGTRGRPIIIEANHLLLTLKKQPLAIHYDVAFKPDVPKKMLRQAMEAIRLKHFPKRFPAFDGRKNLYSAGELPFGDTMRDTVPVHDPERDQPKEFDVTIKRASSVDMSQIANYLARPGVYPQDAIQALDIVLRNPSALRFVPVGRSYFTRPMNQIVSLGNGLELWYGFYQSAILGWKPFLNVDVAHKGFPEAKSLLEVMLDMKAKYGRWNDPRPTYQDLSRGLGRQEEEDLNKFIRGLKVAYVLPNQPNTRRVYKMNGTKKPCSEYRFTLENGRSMTIGEYFEREKRQKLRFPNLPCIHVGNKDVCLPPEFCEILPGQVMNKKMDETQTANMVKAAARPADERKRKIMAAMASAGFNNDPCINEFGVSVSNEFTKIQARVLDPPTLEYRQNKLKPKAGVWRAAEFVQSNKVEKWVVMTLASRGTEQQLMDFAKTMNQQGRSLGMSIAQPYKCLALGNQMPRNPAQLKQFLISYFNEFKADRVQLVVVVIPDRPADSYSKVKLAAEVSVGLLTQCIKERTMMKMNPATAGNILLKINAKLNGVNHTIDRNFCPTLMDAPTMLVGADVTHPSPDQTNIPSVAAVAASHDRRAFQYNMIWRLQEAREEIIVDLQNIIKEQLMFFYKRTGQKPQKIIFYRDGVSEGQFSQVLDREMSAIRRACSSLSAEYKPGVTFLVVQKRHHTRFFPTRREDEDGRNKNVPPGTIVDTMITHPKEMDFYLVSHASLQGTSRPTKYHKLWDDCEISEDDLEELTYYLCHLFSRCTRSVSYPAPTYYAHLAAARGRVYLEGSPINLTNLNQEMAIRQIKEVVMKETPMFFV